MSRLRLLATGLAMLVVFAVSCGSDGPDTAQDPAAVLGATVTEPATLVPTVVPETVTAAATVPTAEAEPITPTPAPSPTVAAAPTVAPDPADRCSQAGGYPAVVDGVDEWVRMRSGPSRDADEMGLLDVATEVQTFPETLTFADNLWWVMVEDPATSTCVHVAARYLRSERGPLDEPIPGVRYEFPSVGVWTSYIDAEDSTKVAWGLDAGQNTSIGVEVTTDRDIDDFIAVQLETFERAEYTFPDDWYQEIDVAGTDRSVLPIAIISESGDGAITQMLLEVDEFLIHAQSYVYIEDLDVAPADAMTAFVESVEVDRDRFLAAARAPTG